MRSRGRARATSAALAPQNYAQWITGESPGLSKAIVQVSHVVLLHEVGIVAEHRDRRRRGLDLRRVVELHFAPGRLRRLTARDELLER